MSGKELENSQVDFYLDKIRSDKSFSKSSRYGDLLTYLVEQAKAGHQLKEQTIGLSLFTENYKDGTSDGTVRVYMYNLRKKLVAYYKNRGADDKIIFSLKKGSYDLLIHAKGKDRVKNPTSKKVIVPLVLLACVMIAILGIQLASDNNTNNTYCWNPFFKLNAINTCIMADQVILTRIGDDIGKLQTLKEVNSKNDFLAFKKQNPQDSLELTDYTFFSKSIPYSINQLSRWFTEHKQHFTTIPESEFNYQNTKRDNLLYIGQFKTMSVSKEVFLRNSKEFSAGYSHFIHMKNGDTTIYQTTFDKGVKAEYAMVSFMPLGNKNYALYFVSNHDIGTMGTVNQFTNPDFLETFYEQLPSTNSYFNALFKVEGINRSDISCELVKLEIIE
ncbi:MAG: hypothetical protein AAF616_00410 [Bacteroidota bacterium]